FVILIAAAHAGFGLGAFAVVASAFAGFGIVVFVGRDAGIFHHETVFALRAVDLAANQVRIPDRNHRLTARALLLETRGRRHDKGSPPKQTITPLRMKEVQLSGQDPPGQKVLSPYPEYR